MTGRIIASLAFIIGGVITWFVLAGLHGFASSQAGMSAGLLSGPSFIDALIPCFACSYFLVSALGIVVYRRRKALRAVALVAHLFLLAAFLGICFEGLGNGVEKFLTGVLQTSVIAGIFFSPWFAIWAFLLLRPR
jgi:hypothetical protein